MHAQVGEGAGDGGTGAVEVGDLEAQRRGDAAQVLGRGPPAGPFPAAEDHWVHTDAFRQLDLLETQVKAQLAQLGVVKRTGRRRSHHRVRPTWKRPPTLSFGFVMRLIIGHLA